MKYSGAVYRPPSEANSLLLQVTIGCSHNKCTFCTMYQEKKFRIRSVTDIENELREYPNKENVRRVFLMDGDALVIEVSKLAYILDLLSELFPNLERVSSYATFNDLANKSVDDLMLLRKKGLRLVYLGLESGCDKVLELINKNCDSTVAIKGASNARKAGLQTSVMVISGLGGRKYFNSHITKTVDVLNLIDPDYLGVLKLNVFPNTLLYKQIKANEFELLDAIEIVKELKQIVSGLNLSSCMFSSAHASNHINVRGILPTDKARIIEEIDYYLNNPDLFNYYKGL